MTRHLNRSPKPADGAMTATRSTLLAVALCGALVAGCGGGSTSISTTGSRSVTSPAAQTTTTTPATSGSTGVGVAQYVAICRSFIKKEPRLLAGKKAKVEGMCYKVSRSNAAGARALAKEVCVEVVGASPIPIVARRKALAACRGS